MKETDYLMHYRTKGSKNGISRTKGYIAKGKLASKDPRIQQNNWQDIANQTAAQTEAAMNVAKKKKK